MHDGEAAYLEKIRATFPTLDDWGAAVAIEYRPDAGSDLAGDDADWPVHGASQIVSMGLASAVDHLKAVRVHIEVGQLFPISHPTLVRGALMGGAQAVWVLAPDDRTVRLDRARCLAAHMYREHEKFVAVAKANPIPGAPIAELEAKLATRQAQLAAKRDADGQRATLDTTHMIREAAASTFADRSLAQAAEAIWRQTSGAAHGFSWGLFGQSGTRMVGPPDPFGMIKMEAGGGIERIASPYLCAFHIAHKGWTLREQRGRR